MESAGRVGPVCADSSLGRTCEEGHWPDADMLPVGKLGNAWGTERISKLTDDEQHTLMNLWTIFRSPLFVGANLPESAAIIPLLTNKEVIAVDQHSSDNHPVVQTPTTVVWLAKAETGGGYYLAVFNIGDTDQTVSYPWKDLKLKEGSYKVRDLWQHKDLGSASSLSVPLKPHASVMYKLTE